MHTYDTVCFITNIGKNTLLKGSKQSLPMYTHGKMYTECLIIQTRNKTPEIFQAVILVDCLECQSATFDSVAVSTEKESTLTYLVPGLIFGSLFVSELQCAKFTKCRGMPHSSGNPCTQFSYRVNKSLYTCMCICMCSEGCSTHSVCPCVCVFVPH